MAIDWDAHVLKPVVSVFGEGATWRSRSGSLLPVTFVGVFDEAYHSIEGMGDAVDMNTRQPLIGIRDADFAQMPRQGDFITRLKTGQQYVIKDVHPDGHGSTKLLLNLVQR